MILDVVPVIPPDIRPMVQLDGGRFAIYRNGIPNPFGDQKYIRRTIPHVLVLRYDS